MYYDQYSADVLQNSLLDDAALVVQCKKYEQSGDNDGVLRMYAKRRELWRKAASLTTNDLIRVMIDVHQESVELNLNLYDHKFKLEEQMGQIISRLDKMEDKLRARFPEFEKKN
jgi:hypothetical protein